MKDFAHIPVMLEECIKGLNIKPDGVYFDGTVGGGGHSFEILKSSSPNGRLIATDLDDDAISAAKRRLTRFDGRFDGWTGQFSISEFPVISSIAETEDFLI